MVKLIQNFITVECLKMDLGSLSGMDKNYYLQGVLEEFRYFVKERKVIRHFSSHYE